VTFDVLSELVGERNFKLISNITPLAISNAFYEQIVLHYELEKLSSDGLIKVKGSKTTTHRRGDLLEAYMAAIEKDISRHNRGYRDVRDWLFRVLALRLGIFQAQTGTHFYSVGSEQKSLSILPFPPVATGDWRGTELESQNNHTLKPESLSRSAKDNTIISPSQADAQIWHHPTTYARSLSNVSDVNLFLSNRSLLSDPKGLEDLDSFRRLLFECMSQKVKQIHQSGCWNPYSFWNSLSTQLSQIQGNLQHQGEECLLFYYRVRYSQRQH
jgi:hypothetical protein